MAFGRQVIICRQSSYQYVGKALLWNVGGSLPHTPLYNGLSSAAARLRLHLR